MLQHLEEGFFPGGNGSVDDFPFIWLTRTSASSARLHQGDIRLDGPWSANTRVERVPPVVVLFNAASDGVENSFIGSAIVPATSSIRVPRAADGFLRREVVLRFTVVTCGAAPYSGLSSCFVVSMHGTVSNV